MVAVHIWALWALVPIFLSGVACGYGVGRRKSITFEEYHKKEFLHVLGTVVPYFIGAAITILGIFEYGPKP
jgi:hypothetical protein